MKIVILIPVYNEASVIAGVIAEVLPVARQYGAVVLMVDDGSRDETALVVRGFLDEGVCVVSHPVNCGVGAAIQTGFEWAKLRGADVVVTMDGDGQHSASDLGLLIDAVVEGKGDIVNGSRFMRRERRDAPSFDRVQRRERNAIPLVRRVGNFFGNVMTWVLSGIWLTDSQSGMKAFNKKALELLNLRTSRYEVCSEMVREAAWFKLRIYEVPISVKYTAYSMSKGQSFSAALSMVVRLVVRSLMR